MPLKRKNRGLQAKEKKEARSVCFREINSEAETSRCRGVFFPAHDRFGLKIEFRNFSPSPKAGRKVFSSTIYNCTAENTSCPRAT